METEIRQEREARDSESDRQRETGRGAESERLRG